MSRLTFSSAFFRSDSRLSSSSCKGFVSTAASAFKSISGTTATMLSGTSAVGCCGTCQLMIAITATAAATPVIVLAHQNIGGLAGVTGRWSAISGVTASSEASIRRSSSSETLTSIRAASSRSLLASLSIGFTLVGGITQIRLERAPSSHQVYFGPRCGPVKGFGNVVDRHIFRVAQPHRCEYVIVQQLPRIEPEVFGLRVSHALQQRIVFFIPEFTNLQQVGAA